MSVSSLKAELKSLGYDLKKIKVKEKSCSCTVIVRDPSINLSTIKDITMRHNQDLSMMVRFDYTLLEAETRNFLREAELLYEVYQNTPPGKREPVYNLENVYWEGYKKDGHMLYVVVGGKEVFSHYFASPWSLAELLFLVKNQFTFLNK